MGRADKLRGVTIDDLDFHLPSELIAHEPPATRGQSRLLHFDRHSGAIADRNFGDIVGLLRSGDLLVFNDAMVLPAQFTLVKASGGRVKGLFVEAIDDRRWRAMLKSVGPLTQPPLSFLAANTLNVRVLSKSDDGLYEMESLFDEPVLSVLQRLGRMPLPPYIRREKFADARDDFDRERYQTVYAAAAGSIAAPTAGLHFTPEILQAIKAREIQTTHLTLHVGLGTFKPIAVQDLAQHQMHTERYTIPTDAAEAINRAKREARRVVAVGTTSARVLESQPAGEIEAKSGETSIFIYPPRDFAWVDAMITNFHLPKSTLVALVMAFCGIDSQRKLYTHAIERGYRFFSYGDAMLIE